VNVPGPPSVTRRSALAAALGVLATGTACTPNSANKPSRRSAPERTPEPLPDVTLAVTVVADERALLDRIDATVVRHPHLEDVLAEARASHATHVALLEDAAPESASPSPSAGATPSAEGSPAGTDPTQVPGCPAELRNVSSITTGLPGGPAQLWTSSR